MQHRHIAQRHWSEGAGLALDAEALSRYNDIIDLSVGDTDAITDGRIIRAAAEDALSGCTRYGDPHGDPALISAIRGMYKARYGMELSDAEVYVTPSSCMGMELALMSVLDPGDEVLGFAPYFTPYKAQTELAGGAFVEVPTYCDEGYALSEERIRAALTPRTRAIILNNPCNPTGALYGQSELALIARIACEHDLIVIADEIYTHYVYDGEFIPMRALDGMAERTITLNSFSKDFIMTGWRVGYAVAAPHFTHTMQRINNNMVYTTPAISQRAALKALQLGDEASGWYADECRRRVYYAHERISALPFMTSVKPRGTFYIFPNIQGSGLDSAAFCAALLERAHVLAVPGSAFGAAGEGCIRLACTVGMDALTEAFDRMEKLRF